ncbi:transposase [Limosilactobacillus fermentum]|uniref:helix-turn-helix domain-containing protein n=1 Tax=Limosilactobacillus fermentum TaxID=1613 RepID=UPI0015BB42CC|nr:helix-turn-helix domain-containing protein [Limosilactobacillus fermentum]QLE76628.1 transposase [Limosilactobacillus fermentum]
MPTRYDKEFKQNIINLYKQGESAAQLAREYGIGYSTVHKWIQGQAKTQSGKSPDELKRWKSGWLPCLRRTKS